MPIGSEAAAVVDFSGPIVVRRVSVRGWHQVAGHRDADGRFRCWLEPFAFSRLVTPTDQGWLRERRAQREARMLAEIVEMSALPYDQYIKRLGW
jgi:hypothetical protein